jgi:hypothetical protein
LTKVDAIISGHDSQSSLRRVHGPAQDKTLKPKKKEKPEAKINKYGFLHVNGKLAKHLGVEFGRDKADVPVSIEKTSSGFVVKLKPA